MQKTTLRRYAIISLGCLIYALAFNWCYAPNDIAYGGFTGVAQIINSLGGFLSVGTLVFFLNLPVFFLGWKLLGGQLLVSSLYAMTLSSFLIDLLDRLVSFSPMDPLLACIYGGAILGVSLGLILGQGATTGGTDLLARLLKLPLPWLPMGKLVMVPDFFGLAVAALAFGRVESALYGIVALYVSAKVMDGVLYGLDLSKVAYIVSDQWRTVADQLMRERGRGVTILDGEGAYTGDTRQVLLIAFKQREIVQIKQTVYETDPKAFLIVCDAKGVLGEGFGEYKKEEI